MLDSARNPYAGYYADTGDGYAYRYYMMGTFNDGECCTVPSGTSVPGAEYFPFTPLVRAPSAPPHTHTHTCTTFTPPPIRPFSAPSPPLLRPFSPRPPAPPPCDSVPQRLLPRGHELRDGGRQPAGVLRRLERHDQRQARAAGPRHIHGRLRRRRRLLRRRPSLLLQLLLVYVHLLAHRGPVRCEQHTWPAKPTAAIALATAAAVTESAAIALTTAAVAVATAAIAQSPSAVAESAAIALTTAAVAVATAAIAQSPSAVAESAAAIANSATPLAANAATRRAAAAPPGTASTATQSAPAKSSASAPAFTPDAAFSSASPD